jgi:outer membrane protein OmpA-like peptidoglycan-associated protein/outer membrane protein W
VAEVCTEADMNSIKKAIVLGATVGLAAAPAAARADWITRLSAAWADPQGSGMTLPPTLSVPSGIGANPRLEVAHAGPEIAGDVTWLFTHDFGVEFWINAPFRSDLRLRGDTGLDTLGTTKYMSPMLNLQWHPLADQPVRPYIGAGVHYTTFSGTPIGTIDHQTNWTAGAGVDFGPPHGGWLLNIYAKYLALHSDGTFPARPAFPGGPLVFPPPAGTGSTTAITNSFSINPWVFGIGIGWRFGHAAPVVVAAPVAAAAPAEAAVTPAPEPPPPPPAKPASACPDTPPGVRVGPMGCPCEMTVQLQFKFDSADLTDDDKQRLDRAAETLQRLHWVSGTIEGHTDSIGTAAYNQGLSERRAETVKQYLISKGVGDQRMRAVGFGETKPIADNATAEGRAQNRRVVMRRTDCDEPAK